MSPGHDRIGGLPSRTGRVTSGTCVGWLESVCVASCAPTQTGAQVRSEPMDV
jgi:hypothetical protein